MENVNPVIYDIDNLRGISCDVTEDIVVEDESVWINHISKEVLHGIVETANLKQHKGDSQRCFHRI